MSVRALHQTPVLSRYVNLKDPKQTGTFRNERRYPFGNNVLMHFMVLLDYDLSVCRPSTHKKRLRNWHFFKLINFHFFNVIWFFFHLTEQWTIFYGFLLPWKWKLRVLQRKYFFLLGFWGNKKILIFIPKNSSLV